MYHLQSLQRLVKNHYHHCKLFTVLLRTFQEKTFQTGIWGRFWWRSMSRMSKFTTAWQPESLGGADCGTADSVGVKEGSGNHRENEKELHAMNCLSGIGTLSKGHSHPSWLLKQRQCKHFPDTFSLPQTYCLWLCVTCQGTHGFNLINGSSGQREGGGSWRAHREYRGHRWKLERTIFTTWSYLLQPFSYSDWATETCQVLIKS